MKPFWEVHFFGYFKTSFSNSLHKIDSRPLLESKHIVWIVDLPFQEVHYQLAQNPELIPDYGLFREGRPDDKKITCCKQKSFYLAHSYNVVLELKINLTWSLLVYCSDQSSVQSCELFIL